MPKFVTIDLNTSNIIDRFETEDTYTYDGRHNEKYKFIQVNDPLDYLTVKAIINEGVVELEEDPEIVKLYKTDTDKFQRAVDILRVDRNNLLRDSDWSQMSDVSMTVEKKQEWLTYRQNLRDLPSNTTDPENPVWPEAPTH